MANSVSGSSSASIAPTFPSVHAGPAHPRTHLARRTSFPFNATQTLAITAVVSVLYLPFAIAGIAHSQSSSSSQLQILNATCAPLVITPLAIAAYLRSGIAKLALVSDHPAAQALQLHQAKRKLLYEEDYTSQQEVSLRCKEAFACHEAAELAQTPEEKLAWVARGLKELKYPSDAITKRFGLYEGDLPQCDVAISLFSTQAQALLSLSDREYTPPDIVEAGMAPTPLQGTLYGAAQAFRHMAHCSRMLKRYQEGADFQQKAIQTLQKIEAGFYPLKEQIALQEEIVSASIGALNIEQFSLTPSQELISFRLNAVFNETMKVQKLYERIIWASPAYKIPYYTMNRAVRLQDAAYYTHNLTQKVELLRTARDIVQKAWNEDEETCKGIPTFVQPHLQEQRLSLWSNPTFSIERSLLGQLQRETQAAEQQLAEQNKPLEKMLIAGWKAFIQWWKPSHG
ncbi:MAG: hypothetical protein JSS10_00455 [Verrucomicrobia bacterium]|nr:hypothetical protein [Verrucomicrobiota bacterium]